MVVVTAKRGVSAGVLQGFWVANARAPVEVVGLGVGQVSHAVVGHGC